MSSRGNRGDNLRWGQRRVGTTIGPSSGSGGGGAPGVGITNIEDDSPDHLHFTVHLSNGITKEINKPTTGSAGPVGPTGPQGNIGITGDSGFTGMFGGLSFLYNINANLQQQPTAELSVGRMRFNTETQKDATEIYLRNSDKNGLDITGVMDIITSGTAQYKGFLRITTPTLGSNVKHLLYRIENYANIANNNLLIYLKPIAGRSTVDFSNNQDVILTFSQNGESGIQGPTGAPSTIPGPTGTPGKTGIIGPIGPTGLDGKKTENPVKLEVCKTY